MTTDVENRPASK